MRKLILSIAFMLLLISNIKAQNNNQIFLQLSMHQFELGYQHKIFTQVVWGEVFAGTGNRDINRNFDDFLSGLRIGFNAFSNEKNLISFNTSVSIYIPNNDYYKVLTPVYGVGVRFNRFIGTSKTHNLSVSTGYQYGEQDYKQEYFSEALKVVTTDNFEIASLYFSLGYGYNF
ncbi:MAG: hypothetical protein M0P66_08190 [Salinivirgaceae bacterium]|nr:hypothetical protein [Salinivirgaceae bacterium]